MFNKEIILLLNEAGIPPHLKGFDAMYNALKMIYEDPECLHQITTKLYPEVAKKVNSTPPRVERNIREAITYVFDNCPPDRIEGLTFEPSLKSGKLTNGAFLGLLYIALQLRTKVYDHAS